MITVAGVLVASLGFTPTLAVSRAARWDRQPRLTRLFSYAPQRHPKATLPHRPDYFCKYLSDGSAIVCCLFNWNDNHGYGGWDCSIGAA